MASLLASDLSTRDRHHLMTSTILPRPIAWITSLDAEGGVNIAPFSFFNGISAKPPLFSVSIGSHRDGTPKSTLSNIERAKAFVVHVVDESHAHQMAETAGRFAPGESKLELVGLKTVASEEVSVPRLVDAPVAMEARLYDTYRPRDSSATVVIGEIVKWHLRDGMLTGDEDDQNLTVDVHKLRPLGRLGYDHYCPVREVFEMTVPR